MDYFTIGNFNNSVNALFKIRIVYYGYNRFSMAA